MSGVGKAEGRPAWGDQPLLRVRDLRVHFRTSAGDVRAVDGVSFDLRKGETLAIVGESGCGKTATAYAILQLHNSPPALYPSGEVLFDGRDLMQSEEAELREIRGRDICMIFQDPMTSLNPVFTIGDQIAEAVLTHKTVGVKEARDQAVEALRDVGIPSPETNVDKYPHEYSGGMLQRAMIAMALVTGPRLLVADEPTTALDVTIQTQILELIVALQRKYDMAVLIITHDLGVVARIADQLLVMYAGRAVEVGRAEEVFADPRMPYTWYLMRAIPRFGDSENSLVPIPGQIPNLVQPPAGCPFHPRCEFALPACAQKIPKLEEKNEGHQAACLVDFNSNRSRHQIVTEKAGGQASP